LSELCHGRISIMNGSVGMGSWRPGIVFRPSNKQRFNEQISLEICTYLTYQLQLQLHHVSKKQHTWLLTTTSANVDRFSKFFHWQIPKETLCVTTAGPSISPITVLLHYLVKLENCANTFPRSANTLLLRSFKRNLLPAANDWRFVRAARCGLSSNYFDHLLNYTFTEVWCTSVVQHDEARAATVDLHRLCRSRVGDLHELTTSDLLAARRRSIGRFPFHHCFIVLQAGRHDSYNESIYIYITAKLIKTLHTIFTLCYPL